MAQNATTLRDRVKQLSYITGSGDYIELASGAANGFSTFRRHYAHDDIVFYAITDGTEYEVGSGLFKDKDNSSVDAFVVDSIYRSPFASSNADNSRVNFGAGTKEVYNTYPATHAVMMGSGINASLNVPQRHGVAVWDSENILNYFSNLVFKEAGGIGVNQSDPMYGLDLGGAASDYSSRVRASGYYVGETGVYFLNDTTGANSTDVGLISASKPYAGGRQFVHFMPNQTNSTTGTDLVFENSGVVNQISRFKTQSAATVFAGPAQNCGSPPCAADYPTFRILHSGDIPDLSTIYGTTAYVDTTSGNLTAEFNSGILAASGTLDNSISGVQTNLNNHIATYDTDFNAFEVASSGRIDTYLDNASGILYPISATVPATVSMTAGDLTEYTFAVNGVTTTDNYTVNASPSGTAGGAGSFSSKVLIGHGYVSATNQVTLNMYAKDNFGPTSVTFNIAAQKIS